MGKLVRGLWFVGALALPLASQSAPHASKAASLAPHCTTLRVTRITDSLPAPHDLATYAYAGTSRRVGLTLGCGVTQNVPGDSTGYTGLDRFGRITDLHFTKGSNTLHRYQYGYDAAGNRLYALVAQVNHVNHRSYAYAYDALNRLKQADRGEIQVQANGHAIITSPSVVTPNLRDWTLDNLGNWTGNTTNAGLTFGDDADGARPIAGASWVTHAVNNANQVTQVTRSTGSPTSLLHDRAGNIVFDGAFFLQYDAFNRLVQVNQAGTLVYSPADPSNDDFAEDAETGRTTGQIKAESVSKLGPFVVRYTYDGLGRLIRRQTPTEPTNPASPMRTEDYYYDGVRRIQENITTPDGQGGSTTETDRQYVYGPDYVDEFVAQIDKGDAGHPDGRVFYMLQDANYNVVALMGLVDSTWQVVEQYTYEPYGALVAKDDLSPGNHPVNRVGHQGLFYEHLDAGDGLTVGAIGLYYNRNRWYSPALGRFISRDPNATALPTLALARDGVSLGPSVGPFAPTGHYRDGMNAYGYLGANPANGLDPSGLFSLLEVSATTAFGLDWDANTAETALSILQGVRGFVDLVGSKNLMLEELLEASSEAFDTRGIDYLIAGFTIYQDVQMARFGAGVLKAGVGLAKTGYRLARCTPGALARTVRNVPRALLRGSKDTKVYLAFKDGEAAAVYTGISNDVPRRAGQHGDRFDDVRAITPFMHRPQARAIEQAIIEKYGLKKSGGLQNKINSIAPGTELYEDAIEWGRAWVEMHKF